MLCTGKGHEEAGCRFDLIARKPAIHGVVRWRLIDLCQWLWEEFRVSVARQTLSRELRTLGYRKLTARPRHHAQAAGAIEHFKTYGPPRPQAVFVI